MSYSRQRFLDVGPTPADRTRPEGPRAPMAYCEGRCVISREECQAHGCAKRKAAPADLRAVQSQLNEATPSEARAALGVTQAFCPTCNTIVDVATHTTLHQLYAL
jgi:hypothetical protein